mgnify:CR=1 FL=1
MKDTFDPDPGGTGKTPVPTRSMGSSSNGDVVEKYGHCKNCGAEGLDNLQIGGDGHWRNKIQCLECFNVRQVHHKDVILPLLVEKYDYSGLREARIREDLSRERYKRATDPSEDSMTHEEYAGRLRERL